MRPLKLRKILSRVMSDGTSGRQSQDVCLILLNKDENHVTQSFLIHSSLWLLSSNSAQKTISPKGDDLHIWIRTLHTQALTDWGPRASKVRSCGNVSMSFIALSTKQIQ